jgi:hypothetical protein
MRAVFGWTSIQAAISALFYFVEHASLPAVPHVDAICGAITEANPSLASIASLLTDLLTSHQPLCLGSPAFVALAQETIAKLEAIEDQSKEPLNIPFKVCGPSCDVCKQLHAFCTVSTATHTEVKSAGASSKNRKHLMSVLEPYNHLVTIDTHTSR